MNLFNDRISNNAADTTRLPVNLSHLLYALRPRGFYDMVKTHEERLIVLHSAESLMRLENESCAFKKHVSSSQKAVNNVTKFEKCAVKVATCLQSIEYRLQRGSNYLQLFAAAWLRFFQGQLR